MIGLIGKKVGMTRVFDEKGVVTPVTVIQVEPNLVLRERTPESDGYNAKVLAAGKVKEGSVTKPYRGQFGEFAPRSHMVEFRDFDGECATGDELDVSLFSDALFVDVTGVSKGKGFQGVMKRHNFGGGRATHGSKFKREAGATGMAATPSRVHKGTKMAGRMGHDRRTVHNLRVMKVDTEKQVILVKGSVPGPRNSTILVTDAKKKN